MLTPKQRRKMTELALIRSIPTRDDLENMIPGRLKGLFIKLQKAVDKELSKFTFRPDQSDIDAIEIHLDEFGRATGWNGKKRHVTSMVSFCLDVIDRSEFDFPDRIVEILNDIIDYFERAGKQRQICYLSGCVAADKWESLFSGI